MLMERNHTATGDLADVGQTMAGSIATHEIIFNCTGSGTITATIVHEGTNDVLGATGWKNILTSSVTGAADGTIDSQVLQHSWHRTRSRCTAISGAGGTPSVRSTISMR